MTLPQPPGILTQLTVSFDAASSSEEILISKASLEQLPAAGAAVGGMRRFFDIAVPRNIASDVNQLGSDAHVYNVDDLKEVSVIRRWTNAGPIPEG